MNTHGWTHRKTIPGTLAVALLAGCGPAPEAEVAAEAAAERRGDAAIPAASDPLLRATLQRSLALADSVEDLLRPVPLITPAQENRLRQHLNAAHVARGRAIVTPDTRRLLVRIAERFQDHLGERGLPAYRLEVTSVLRTATRPHLEQVAALALESVSARKSRELTAFLADVLAAMQAEGLVLVILERQQPVFHITLGRRIEA